MNFSTTTEYALRIMSYMSLDEKKLYKATDIIEELAIPQRYLRKLMTRLSKSDIIKSIQGKYGGYMIARDLSDISLLDIVTAAGEKINQSECFFGLKNCTFSIKCQMHHKWADINKQIYEVLSNTTLLDIKKSNPRFLIKDFNSNNSPL